jgi:hypothetical protein
MTIKEFVALVMGIAAVWTVIIVAACWAIRTAWS